MRQDFKAWCKWHNKKSCFRSMISYLKVPENRLIMHMRQHELGGGCPRTTDHKSEILQSVSSSDDSCLSYGNNYQLLGGNTSNPSSATYNLKVENSQN